MARQIGRIRICLALGAYSVCRRAAVEPFLRRGRIEVGRQAGWRAFACVSKRLCRRQRSIGRLPRPVTAAEAPGSQIEDSMSQLVYFLLWDKRQLDLTPETLPRRILVRYSVLREPSVPVLTVQNGLQRRLPHAASPWCVMLVRIAKYRGFGDVYGRCATSRAERSW